MAKRKNDRYEPHENAVSITLYDLGGNKVPDELVRKLTEYASELALENETLAVDFVRT